MPNITAEEIADELKRNGVVGYEAVLVRKDQRIAELEAALRHAVEIAENKIVGGTWDDLLPYRKLLSR